MKGLKLPAALISAALVFLGIQWMSTGPVPGLPSTESFRYELDQFMKVDPALVRFEETGRVDLPGFQLTALAVDGSGRVLVAAGRELLIIENLGDLESWKTLERFQLPASASCLAAGGEGRIYVGAGPLVYAVEEGGDVIQEPWELGERGFATALAVYGDNVYVSDAGNRIVWLFTAAGQLISQIGQGNGNSGGPGFIVPSPYFDAAVDGTGSLWVVNPGRLRIERYNRAGELEQMWGSPSMRIEGFAGCCNPAHIALLPDGGVVTSEKGIPRVKVYNPDGTLESVVAGPDLFAPGTADLDLAVDEMGNVLILDPKAGALRIFSPLNETEEAGEV